MAAIEQKPRRFVDDFTEPGEAYPVRATDIDIGRHVNNLAYVRAIRLLHGRGADAGADI